MKPKTANDSFLGSAAEGAQVGLDVVELVMAIEDEFQIAIPNEIAATFARLGDMHAYVVRALGERTDPADAAAIWERLKRVVMRCVRGKWCPRPTSSMGRTES